MSEQAEATSPTATEETVTEASPPGAAEASEAEAAAAPTPEGQQAQDAAPKAETETTEAAAATTGAAEATDKAETTDTAETAETAETAQVEAQAAEPQTSEPQTSEPQTSEPQTSEPQQAAPAPAEEAAEAAAAAPPETPKEAVAETPAAEPAETQPAETQAAETQPAETQPAESQPAETQAAETQPAETQPAESQPAETQAAEAKATETPVAETKAAETPAAETQPAESQPAEAPAAEAQATETPAAEAQATETQPAESQPAEAAETGTAPAAAATTEPTQPTETPTPAEAQADAGGETAEGEAKAKKEPKPLTEEEKARLAEIEALRQAKDNHEPVTGRVIGWNQGGFHVVIGTITTFCPRSELELKNPKSPNYYLDKEFQFYVIKHQKKGKRIVVSRKQLLEQERAKILESMKDTLVPGKDLEGRVSSITDFGAFVDVGGGIEGLVHVTELSNRRIKHPRDFVELGQEVKVRVLKVEEGGERISLSMKALEPNPYDDFAQGHPRGSKFQGKVVRKTDFGIFIELLPGLDGMVHISQLPPGKSPDHEDFEVGKEVGGWVLRVEPKRERISLSLKEVPTDDPWKDVRERYPEGAVVQGQVEDVAPFGVFIQLEPGLTGLLPNSEMNLPRGQDRSKHFPPGKKVEIQVASVDPQRKRISLAPEGAQIEGSRTDYRDYMKQQKRQNEGMTAMAAAFAKLKDPEHQAGE